LDQNPEPRLLVTAEMTEEQESDPVKTDAGNNIT
jgi:hypothetical protein